MRDRKEESVRGRESVGGSEKGTLVEGEETAEEESRRLLRDFVLRGTRIRNGMSGQHVCTPRSKHLVRFDPCSPCRHGPGAADGCGASSSSMRHLWAAAGPSHV